MAIKKGNVYKCMFCEYTHEDPKKVDFHRDREHEFVLVPIQVSELSRLLQFIMTKEDKILPPELYQRLQVYLNNYNKLKGTRKVRSSDD